MMDDRALLTEATLERVRAELRALPEGATPPALEHEPLLAAAVGERFQLIAGRLALSGAPRPLINRVMGEVDRLVVFALTAQRSGYQAVLADLLPEEDAEPNGDPRRPGRACDPGPRGQRDPADDPDDHDDQGAIA
jgi:hypothetical protein